MTNRAIEGDVSDAENELIVCACPTNEAGDIPCHRCREYVNKVCWKCKTKRGAGECPTIAAEFRRRGWASPQDVGMLVLAAGGEVRVPQSLLVTVGAGLEVSVHEDPVTLEKILRARQAANYLSKS